MVLTFGKEPKKRVLSFCKRTVTDKLNAYTCLVIEEMSSKCLLAVADKRSYDKLHNNVLKE